MSSIQAINAVRDSLRTNLTDPRATAGDTHSRTFVYTDTPDAGTKYPRVQITKIDNPTQVLTIGYNYAERERLFLNIWFYTKRDFKLVIGGVTYNNEQLVEYYLGLIKTTLKAQASTLHTAGAIGYKHLNTTNWEYDPDTQLYYAAVTIGVEFYTSCT